MRAVKDEQRTLGNPVHSILQVLFEEADAYVEQAELRTEPEDLDDDQLLARALRARDALRGLGYKWKKPIDYKRFPGLAGVFLEDSYVLGISESSEQVVFHLDAVLTPEHPAYHSPRLGEQYCYANGNLIFPDVTQIVWLNRNSSHYTDASGEQDLGNIDILTVDGDAFVAEGDWGAVRISGAQPRFELRG